MAPSASCYELTGAVRPPYRERVVGDTVIAAGTFGRRPDGQYGTGTVVGFERYLGGPAGALVQLDHDGEVDWFPLAELYLLHPAGGAPPAGAARQAVLLAQLGLELHAEPKAVPAPVADRPVDVPDATTADRADAVKSA